MQRGGNRDELRRRAGRIQSDTLDDHRLLRDRRGNRNKLRRRAGRLQHIRDDHKLLRDRRGNRNLTIRRRAGRVQQVIRDDHQLLCYRRGNRSNAVLRRAGWVQQPSSIYTASFASGNVSGGTYRARLCPRDESTEISTGAHLTTAQMTEPSHFLAFGWDFATTWQMGIVVPTLTGGDLDNAGKLLYPVGCTVGTITYAYSATVAAGLIISQSVAAGSGTATTPTLQALTTQASPKTGDTVDVVVSLGNSVEVPNTLGLTQAAAEALLTASDFSATASTATSETVAAGLVFDQTPAGGTSATWQSAVAITVSTGPSLGVVPGVLGLSLANATTAITTAGFTADSDTDYSSNFAAGLVMAQTPAAGTSATLGDTVTVTVSLGLEQVTVPNVVGSTTAAATVAIEAVGLTAVQCSAYSSTVAAGIVISQDPAAGASTDDGGTVNITVSLGVEPVTVPDVIGDTQATATSTLVAAGLTATVGTAYSGTVTTGNVINQIPSAGSTAFTGDAVIIIVSLGVQPFSIVDIEGEIVSLINATGTVTAWRNRMNVGFSNTAKAAFVRVDNDRYHMTGKTRNVVCTIRVYGGSSKMTDLRGAVDAIVQALTMKTTTTIASTGDLTCQYLPPEPETGWPSASVRLNIRVKE
jgi:beta-lactam-binding protein with PASTA domain